MEEALRLKDVVSRAGLDLTVKVGGCEALLDMYNARAIGVTHLVGPMVETPFALHKYLGAVKLAYPPEERDQVSFLVNIETIDAVRNFPRMLELPEIDELDGIVLGRVDLTGSIGKTRESFLTKLSSFIAVNELSEEFWVRLEESLIAADVGAETTVALLDKIRKTAEEERWREVSEVMPRLESELLEILYEAMPEARAQAKAKEEPAGLLGRLFGQTKPAQTEQPTLPPLPNLPSSADGKFPYVILVVGVNGSGKTTSIAKLAALHKASGRRVLLAAGDTFRAAAIDQLKIWGERVGVDVIAHQPGSDPAAVAFDAWEAARARNVEVLIVDTAGRLQTKFNLMQELEKTARVLKKQDPTAPQETLLVMDAVTGQNGLSQAREFKKTVPLSRLILTKLDGTAKGGIVFAIAKELKLPIKFIGTGEGVDDFAPFDPQEFVDDLLETDRT